MKTIKRNFDLKNIINKYNNIVLFTGAGVSTLSDIPDFKNNLYKDENKFRGYNAEQILTKTFFNREENKEIFWSFYEQKLLPMREAKPNKIHFLAKKLYDLGKLKAVITQNIDGLYNQVDIPTEKIIEIHGNLELVHCSNCSKTFNVNEIDFTTEKYRYCNNCKNNIKTNILLYDEVFDYSLINKYHDMLDESDCIIVMGTMLDVLYHKYAIASAAKSDVYLVNNEKIDLLDVTGYKRQWNGEYIIDFKKLEINI